jgi:TolA-binding protein
VSRAALALMAALALGAVEPAGAQSSADEQARGLLEDGRAYLRSGKSKQALDNFQTIVTGFSGTDSVDDALLEIGRHQMDSGETEKAREAFEQVAQRYPQSDGAPGAYYQLGRLTLDRAATASELDDALAQFTRVSRLYPRSPWVARALYGTALAHRKAGRLAEALEAARRVTLEYPSSEAAPEAHFQAGHLLALMGEPRQAMEEFQRIRNRFPASEWAPRALDRTTALYRLFGSGPPAFRLDPTYQIGAGDTLKDVRAILMTPARTLWVASDKVKSAIPFGPEGKITGGYPAADLSSLSLGPRGETVVISARTAVRFGAREVLTFSIPSDKPGQPEPLERIEAALLTPAGAVLVSDRKRKRVYRFDRKGQYQQPFPDAKEREVTRMALDPEGGIVMLDGDEKTVRVFDEAGKVLRTVPPRGTGWQLQRPADVAVDPFRNLYVADEGAVHVFSPQGQLLVSITAPEMRKAVAVTLDPAGAVLVYDEKAERILRFR